MSLADSIRRSTDEWVERKRREAWQEGYAEGWKEGFIEGREEGRAEVRQERRREMVREFIAAREEGRLDELLAAYGCQPSEHETQYLENRG